MHRIIGMALIRGQRLLNVSAHKCRAYSALVQGWQFTKYMPYMIFLKDREPCQCPALIHLWIVFFFSGLWTENSYTKYKGHRIQDTKLTPAELLTEYSEQLLDNKCCQCRRGVPSLALKTKGNPQQGGQFSVRNTPPPTLWTWKSGVYKDVSRLVTL